MRGRNDEEEDPFRGPTSINDGQVLKMPGFCIRLTDFTCYFWAPLRDLDAYNDVGLWDADDTGGDTFLYDNSQPSDGTDVYSGFYGGDSEFGDYEGGWNGGWNYNGEGFADFPSYNGSGMSEDNLYDWGDGFINFGEDSPEKKIANFIYIYISPIFLFFGTLCNFFTVLVMMRLGSKVLSTCVYLGLLAVLDTLVLYARCGNDWLREVAQVDITYNLLVRSEAICKVYPFFFNFIFHLARWLIVCVAVDGLIATKFTHKVCTMCTLSRTKSTILLLTVILVCMNVHFFWSYELVNMDDIPDQEGYMCTFDKHGHQYSAEFQMVVWPIIDLLLSELLPLTIVCVCTGVMVVQVVRGKHKGSRAHQAWCRRYMMDPTALNQLKLVFMYLGVIYPLLTIPKLGYTIFTYIQERFLEYDFTLENKRALAHGLCASVEYFFFAFKFLLYVAVSRKFRHEFASVIRCKCSDQKQVDVERDTKEEPLIKSVNNHNQQGFK